MGLAGSAELENVAREQLAIISFFAAGLQTAIVMTSVSSHPVSRPPPEPVLIEALKHLQQTLPQPLATSNQGVIYPLDVDGCAMVVKTLPPASRLNVVHLRALQREYRAYQCLQGLRGFARCHGLFEQRWLLLERIDGTPFREAALRSEDRFFDHLFDNIQAMHERGVAHGDLKRKANLMVDPQMQPVLLDFGAAVIRKPGFHPLNQRLFSFMRQTDLNAWVKLKYGGYSNLSAEDAARLKRSWLERGLSRIRKR